jgi:hypothetical protein
MQVGAGMQAGGQAGECWWTAGLLDCSSNSGRVKIGVSEKTKRRLGNE